MLGLEVPEVSNVDYLYRTDNNIGGLRIGNTKEYICFLLLQTIRRKVEYENVDENYFKHVENYFNLESQLNVIVEAYEKYFLEVEESKKEEEKNTKELFEEVVKINSLD